MMNREIRKNAADLRATEFKDAIVWLPGLIMESMADRQMVIKGRTFTNCLLHGPAVFLALKGVALEGCNIGYARGDVKNLLLRPVSSTSVVGAIPFEDCRFVDCDFDKIGFTGADSFLESVLAVPVGETP